MQTETTISRHLVLLSLRSTVPIIAVRRIPSLDSIGFVQRVDGIILGTAIACTAHCLALDAHPTALMHAAIRMAKSSLEFASCDAPLRSTVMTSPTSRPATFKFRAAWQHFTESQQL